MTRAYVGAVVVIHGLALAAAEVGADADIYVAAAGFAATGLAAAIAMLAVPLVALAAASPAFAELFN